MVIMNEDFKKVWPKVIAKAWSDPSFKKRLMTDPHSVLAEFNYPVPSGTKIQIHENSSTVVHLTLPRKPTEELSVKELESIAAGHGGRGCEHNVCE